MSGWKRATQLKCHTDVAYRWCNLTRKWVVALSSTLLCWKHIWAIRNCEWKCQNKDVLIPDAESVSLYPVFHLFCSSTAHLAVIISHRLIQHLHARSLFIHSPYSPFVTSHCVLDSLSVLASSTSCLSASASVTGWAARDCVAFCQHWQLAKRKMEKKYVTVLRGQREMGERVVDKYQCE